MRERERERKVVQKGSHNHICRPTHKHTHEIPYKYIIMCMDVMRYEFMKPQRWEYQFKSVLIYTDTSIWNYILRDVNIPSPAMVVSDQLWG